MGKSGSAGLSYDYYGSLACGICCGPVDDLVGIILDGQAVWPKGNAWGQTMAGAGDVDTGFTMSVHVGDLYVYDAQTWRALQDMTITAATPSDDPTIPGNDASYWVEYTFARTQESSDTFGITVSDATLNGTPYGNLRFYWGTNTQPVDPILLPAGNDGQDLHPPYLGVCYCVPVDFLLGQEVQAAPSLEFILRRAPQQSVVTGDSAGIVDGQCNLAAFVAEILTSQNGLALPVASLDSVSFNAVATYLANNELLYGASPLIDSSDTLRTVIDNVTAMIDGFVRYNPATKLIEMGVYQHGVTPSTYTTLTEDSLTERPQLKSSSWQQTFSRATVRYSDRTLNYQQTSIHADDPRAWAILQSVREQTLDRPWICRSDQALLHGREWLRVMGHAPLTGSLSVRREIGRNIRAGDYVLLDVDIEPNLQTVSKFCRVTKRTIPMTGPIKLEVQADNTLAPVPWNNGRAPAPNSQPEVAAVEKFVICEIPTVLAGERGAVATLVQRPGNLVVGCQVYFETDPTGTFSSLGNFRGFAARGRLSAPIAATDTSLFVMVDTTQPDVDFFSQQFTDNEQADDTMLAFIVQRIADVGQPDDGQIAENAGYALLEICSVGAQTLIGGLVDTNGNPITDENGNQVTPLNRLTDTSGNPVVDLKGQSVLDISGSQTYQLSVLRGRQNTVATPFPNTNVEVWLIPRQNVQAFNAALFSTLRANRAAGSGTQYGQFRFSCFTFSDQRPLADCENEPFRFPLTSLSAPSLTISTPTTLGALTYAVTSYPVVIPVVGEWNDPDGNLVEMKVLLRAATETSDRLVFDQTVPPTGSAAFQTNVQIEQAGNYTIKIIARDSTNFVTENDIEVSVTGSGAVCATPQVFDKDGNTLLDAYFHRTHNPVGFAPLGRLTLLCSTPGATIYFSTTGLVNINGSISQAPYGTNYTYAPGSTEPWHGMFDGGSSGFMDSYTLTVWATVAGMADSPSLPLTMVVAVA